MPEALAMGIPWEVFWHLNPKKFKPFITAKKKKMVELDQFVHTWIGTYGMSALTTAISKCFSKNSTAEYIKENIMSKIANENLTDIEKQKEVDKFFAEQRARRMNWKRQKSKKERSDDVETS